jgi:hypothetical protein
MKQSQQGVRSTKVIDEDAMLEAETHPKPIPGVKIKDVYLRVFDTTKKAMYTDQPSRFPITSAGRHKYTMVAVELDGNYIDAEPMKSQTAKELTKPTNESMPGGKPRGSSAPIGTFLITKPLRNF